MSNIDKDRITEWAKTYINSFLKSTDPLMDLYVDGEKWKKEELLIFVAELLSREDRKKATGIRLEEKDIDDDCVQELCKLDWLEVLELPANNLSNKAIRNIANSFPDLKRLIISGNPNITDIRELQKLTQLEELFASNLPLKMDRNDFTRLINKTRLRALIIRDSRVDEKTLEALKVALLKNSQDGAYLNGEKLEERKPTVALQSTTLRAHKGYAQSTTLENQDNVATRSVEPVLCRQKIQKDEIIKDIESENQETQLKKTTATLEKKKNGITDKPENGKRQWGCCTLF